MQTSIDQLRDLAVGAIETVQDHTDGLVNAGAGRAVGTVDSIVERAPSASIEISGHGGTHRLRTLVIVAIVVAVGLVIGTRINRSRGSSGATHDDHGTRTDAG